MSRADPIVLLVCALIDLGFEMRVRGSHHIFRRAGILDKINLQREGNNAKPYQIKQVRNVIVKYKLGGNRRRRRVEMIFQDPTPKTTPNDLTP